MKFHLIIRFIRLHLGLWLLGAGFATALAAHAQPPAVPFYPSELTGGMRPLVDLQGSWTDADNQTIEVPFQDMERASILMHRSFALAGLESLPDTLFLYFEGVAWSSEIYLNGRLIAITEDPFAEYLFALDKQYFLPDSNQIEVRLDRKGQDFFLYPQHFIGIFRQVLVLAADPAGPLPEMPHTATQPTHALLLAPWTKAQGYLHDTLAISSLLDGFFSVPKGAVVYFPFRPSSRALAMASQFGARMVPLGQVPDSLGFYNTYPVNHNNEPLLTPFWRKTDQRPASDYGRYLTVAQVRAPHVMPLDKLSLLIFLLVPVIIMLLLKLFLPRVFSALPEYLTRSNIYMELIASSKFLKEEQRLVMNLVRIIFFATSLSLYIYYLSVTGNWGRLNVLSAHSMLYQVYSGTDYSLYVIFLQVFLVALGLTLLKYFFLNLTASVYRIHNFGPVVQSLDVFASFPVNILPMVPGAIIFFLDTDQGRICLGIWYALMLIYILRRMVLTYNGLGRLFQLSTSLKILHICTLEISPWIFLL
jgi:hypothetical protein